MWVPYYFTVLDPVKGEFNCYPIDHAVNRMLARARKLLKGKDILKVIEIADYLADSTKDEYILYALEKIADSSEDPESIKYYDEHECERLLYLENNIDLEADFNTEKCKWSDIYAVHALSTIAIAQYEFNKKEHEISMCKQRDMYSYEMASAEYEQLGNSAYFILLAAEILELAHIRRCEESKNINNAKFIKSIISEKMSLAALEKHRPTREIKNDFIKEFLSNPGKYPSQSEAARRFYDALPETKKRHLAPTNAIRTLCNALSSTLKTQSK